MYRKGQMVKTLRKTNDRSQVRNVFSCVYQRKCKTNYLVKKRFSLAVSVNRLNQNTHETKYASFLYDASLIFVDLILLVCMTGSPSCKLKSQLSLSLPLPISMIHLSLNLPPFHSPVSKAQGQLSAGNWLCALLPSLRPTPYTLSLRIGEVKK
jgi:hypothetical protein